MLEDKLHRAVEVGDCGTNDVTKAELASFQIKKYQGLAVRASLKRMSGEATNIAQELRAEELRHAIDRHIASDITGETVSNYKRSRLLGILGLIRETFY